MGVLLSGRGLEEREPPLRQEPKQTSDAFPSSASVSLLCGVDGEGFICDLACGMLFYFLLFPHLSALGLKYSKYSSVLKVLQYF